MEIFTGTSGYSYNEWKGNFYPEKISASEMLSFYSGRLPAVEINNTFYRMPSYNVMETWAEKAGPGFVFAIKAPQVITHIKRLKNVREETGYFIKMLKGLGAKLGPVLFQFPGSFRKNLEVLDEFLGIIPPAIPCAFDFRSASWFTKETFDLLGKKEYCICLEDTDEKPINEIISTASWGYLRMRRADYTGSDLAQWATTVLSQKWVRAFVFFKHEDDAAARGPELALSFKEYVNRGKTAGAR